MSTTPIADALNAMRGGLEDVAVEADKAQPFATWVELAQLSIAVSLKRIADDLCNEEEGNVRMSLGSIAYYADLLTEKAEA